jgi:5'-methylthioadenosine phosphorylase
MSSTSPRAEIGIIGGTGLYSLFDDPDEHVVETPFGEPAGPLGFAEVDGRSVAFLPRHGLDHGYLPHEINYRANAWALASVGVTQIVACCAVGSLQEDVPPGSLVVPDQLVDRTSGRTQTFFSGRLAHVPFADPYCPHGRATVVRAAAGEEIPVTGDGTMVVIDGPRFSTRAESRWYSRQGWSLINMTGHPEAVLARELGLCYTTIALVTDYDAGVDSETAVVQDDIFKMFKAKLGVLSQLLFAVVPDLPAERTCLCTRALDGIEPAFDFTEQAEPA